MSSGNGGPGDHPGVTIVPLTSDTDGTAAALTTALSTGSTFLFEYEVGGGLAFAVLVTGYKGK